VTEAFAASVTRAAVSEETTAAPAEEKKKHEEGEDEDTVRLFFSIYNEYGLKFPVLLRLWTVRLNHCLLR